VAHYKWLVFADVVAVDAALIPKMDLTRVRRRNSTWTRTYVASTHPNEFDSYQDIIRVIDLGDWAVFDLGLAWTIEED
jgi:hypothetical protein